MSSIHHRREICRLCASQQLQMVLPMAATPVGDAYVAAEHLDKPQETYPLDLWLCRSCGLAQLIEMVDPEILYVDYPYLTSISLGLPEHFRCYAKEVVDRINPPRNALVVDIGSNDGSLLKAFADLEMRVLGIDPARDAGRLANQSGVETLTAFFNGGLARQLTQQRGAAAIITANNVFANIDSLDDLIAGVRTLLAPDGVFVFETSYIGDVLEKTLVETIFHEHLSYFSVKPLRSFFQRHSMELIDIQRVSTKGGSIRGTVQLRGGRRPVRPSVDEVVAYEDRLGLHSPEIFGRLRSKLDMIKADLTGLLYDLKAHGKRIAGYGASVGSVTLLYEFELSGLLDFLVDDNKRKQNTFSPGHHIAVLASEAIYDRKIDALVILAWAYADPIMGEHQGFLQNGGSFVVPLPEVRVVRKAS
jgi:SAM-dependent methyltransferase